MVAPQVETPQTLIVSGVHVQFDWERYSFKAIFQFSSAPQWQVK